jgi:hypothetical protein
MTRAWAKRAGYMAARHSHQFNAAQLVETTPNHLSTYMSAVFVERTPGIHREETITPTNSNQFGDQLLMEKTIRTRIKWLGHTVA